MPDMTRLEVLLEQYSTHDAALARIAELEAEVERLKTVIYDTAHVAGTLGSGSDGWLRGRFMSISNALNAAIDRAQSSHGEHYDNSGKIIERG